MSVSIKYNPDSIKINDFNTDNTDCSYIIEKNIDSKNGILNLSCVLLNYKKIGQKNLSIGKIIVTPQKTGSFDLTFDMDDTKVLANDGLGTNVLRVAQSGGYRVDNFNLDFTKENKTGQRSFVVYSSTHPNENRWYNAKNVKFVWIGKKDAVYRYAFDSEPNTIPSGSQTTNENTIAFKIPTDGVFYFHLQLDSGGPIAHFKIKSDFTPPTILSMIKSTDDVYQGDVVRFAFNAIDNVSGIQKNYYVDLGGHLFLPVGSEMFVPFLSLGKQSITLRVYDTAGNYAEQMESINVLEK
ncbi:MAG: hypothetical protein NTX85_01935 [Candidatus Nomurabacteria bacterium]|nr:hypothetical protein [Candidatus Nomurabacteria bacterium]